MSEDALLKIIDVWFCGVVKIFGLIWKNKGDHRKEGAEVLLLGDMETNIMGNRSYNGPAQGCSPAYVTVNWQHQTVIDMG